MPELKDFTSSVAVLVSSCDSFFDAWRPFTVLFRKFWPDCPFKIFLIVNQLRIRSSLLQPIAVGPDRGWSSNLQLALTQITHPYVLYIQEDYFLTEPVQRNQLGADFESALESDADSLCFRARTHIDQGFAPINERFGVVPRDSDGRTRCQVTLWKRTALQSILRSDETAWNFEARGSERTTDLRILSYAHRENTPIRYVMSAISRGLWMPEALALCREHRIEIDPFFRPVYSPRAWQRRLQRVIGRSRLRRQLARRHEQILALE
jgi:hypothetical protein